MEKIIYAIYVDVEWKDREEQIKREKSLLYDDHQEIVLKSREAFLEFYLTDRTYLDNLKANGEIKDYTYRWETYRREEEWRKN